MILVVFWEGRVMVEVHRIERKGKSSRNDPQRVNHPLTYPTPQPACSSQPAPGTCIDVCAGGGTTDQ